MNVDHPNRHRPAGGGYAGKLGFVCAIDCVAGDNPILFGDLVVDGEKDVGKAGAHGSGELLEALHPGCLSWGGIVIDIVSGDELVGCGEIAFVKDLLKEPMEDRLVLFLQTSDALLSCV